jgi:hypothetical protein
MCAHTSQNCFASIRIGSRAGGFIHSLLECSNCNRPRHDNVCDTVGMRLSSSYFSVQFMELIVRLSAITLVFLLSMASELSACIGIGTKVPVDCIDESGGKNCTCQPFTNGCTVTMTVRYSIVGGSNGAQTLRPGETNRDSCTTRRGQSVAYQGYELLGRAVPEAKKLPDAELCKSYSIAARDLYRKMSALGEQGLEATGCSDRVKYYQKALDLADGFSAIRKTARAECGPDWALRDPSEMAKRFERYIREDKRCEPAAPPRRRDSAPAQSTSSSSSSSDDGGVQLDPIPCFGNCTGERPRGSDITGLPKKR